LENCAFKITTEQLYNIQKNFIIDFSLFLIHLSSFLVCNTTTEEQKTEELKKIKHLIFHLLDSIKWDEIEYKKHNRLAHEYALSKQPIIDSENINKNLVLKYKNYESMEAFLKELISQIPKSKRNIDDLKRYFNFFFPHENYYKDKTEKEKTKHKEEVATIFQFPKQLLPHFNTPTTTTKKVVDMFVHDDDGVIEVTPDEKTLIYLYSDIIKPRILGDMQTRYLRIIPMKKNEFKFEFKNIEYCPIEQTYIESISILLADGQGNKIEFNDSFFPTYIMLHF
jgi:hypothetical protein